MWEHPATQKNVATLVARGAVIVQPGEGHLASGARGAGRLADLEDIVDTVRATLGRGGDLAHKVIVVTAGGTQEPLDPVRVIANHSSGKMGFALAQAARARGARVTLIAGTTSLRTGHVPRGMEFVSANSAREMRTAVLHAIVDADALVMAAAVADFRPEQTSEQKIKKNGVETLMLELVKNPDILADVARHSARPTTVIGFAAETQDLLTNARAKLESKNLDLIVANPVPSSFGSDVDQATLITRGGVVTELPPMAKEDLAEKILDFVARFK